MWRRAVLPGIDFAEPLLVAGLLVPVTGLPAMASRRRNGERRQASSSYLTMSILTPFERTLMPNCPVG